MGVLNTTDEGKTALFDSVSMTAFGPVFKDQYEAEDFLKWLEKQANEDRSFAMGYDNIYFLADPRVYRLHELEEVVRIYRENKEAEAVESGQAVN